MQNSGYGINIQRHVIVFHEPVPATVHADHLVTGPRKLEGGRADYRVESRAVAATGENRYLLRHQTTSIILSGLTR